MTARLPWCIFLAMTIPLGAARHARTPEETFLLRLEKTDTCWLWTGVPNLKGYGVFNTKPRRHMAHRFAYLLWVGPIPPGYEVDHLCGVRLCCRPEHLEAVTHRENVRRSANHVGVKARKTVCWWLGLGLGGAGERKSEQRTGD